ncbi:Tat pathway signal sequence domain protein, partial [Metarhizium majus ARSEF 297]
MRILLILAGLVLGVLAATTPLNFLDLPMLNADGEQRGGVNPSLPHDKMVLEQALTAARSAHVPPLRYQALLRQYWLVRATDEAGISLRDWDTQRTAKQNRDVIFAVYNYYARLYLEHPELRWMAFANIAGSAFAAGMLDLDSLPDGWYASILMSMQKHIFMDIGTMHVAYVHGGLEAVQEMQKAGLVDAETTAAWANPPSGVLQFSNREQNIVIAGQFARFRAHQPLGELVTYGMTVVGPMPVPGAKTPAEYEPLLCGPLPAFNYADQRARWDYLSNDTVPAYLRLDPVTVRAIVSRPLANRVDDFRTAHRLVDIIFAQLKATRCGLLLHMDLANGEYE